MTAGFSDHDARKGRVTALAGVYFVESGDSVCGGLTQAGILAPFASQLAFVWDISAWLTSELSVGGARLCSDL